MSRPRAVVAPAAVAALLALAGCGSGGTPDDGPPTYTQGPPTTAPPTPEDTGGPTTGPGAPRVARTVAEGLEVPWGLDFLPDGDAVVGERDSRRLLRVSPEGAVSELGTVEAAHSQGEAGLLGVAVSPDFDADAALYVYASTETDNRVLRYTLTADTLSEPEVVLDGIPHGFLHDGGRIAFGPDGFLYVSTGETGDPALAQDPDSLAGKILRITPEGDPAPGNPDPDSPVWTSGHRNVQGLAWDEEGRLWASEFGDQTFDELNLIEAGHNYGWPEVEGTGGGADFTDPQLVWPTDQASPSGLAYADGRLWMAGLRGQRLWRIDVGQRGARRPTAFLTEKYGRLRTVAAAPDGTLWVTTSNRDGRGNPAEADDRILVVEP